MFSRIYCAMNAIFTVVFILSTVILLIIEPNGFLSALLEGSAKSASVCVSLLATYAVWLGLMQVWEDSGVSRAVSKLLKPLTKKLFRIEDDETVNTIAMNLSVNVLGISGAGTPYGIQACKLLDKTDNAEYASSMFFALNATSIQLLPTSIIGVRVAMHSASPYDVVLPILLTSLFSTLLAVCLTRLCIPPKRTTQTMPVRLQTKEAGIY